MRSLKIAETKDIGSGANLKHSEGKSNKSRFTRPYFSQLPQVMDQKGTAIYDNIDTIVKKRAAVFRMHRMV